MSIKSYEANEAKSVLDGKVKIPGGFLGAGSLHISMGNVRHNASSEGIGLARSSSRAAHRDVLFVVQVASDLSIGIDLKDEG